MNNNSHVCTSSSLLFFIITIFILALTQMVFAQFSGETQWAIGQGIGSQGHWIGDFNGDGLSDKLNYIGSGHSL